MSDLHPATPFHELDEYIDLPRGSGLMLSPDCTRLVTAVQTLNPKSDSTSPRSGRPTLPASGRRDD